MPLLAPSSAGALPRKPLTAAGPLPVDTQSTFPPRAATCCAKSLGTCRLNETMWRPVGARAVTTRELATAANCGVRRMAGSDGKRASRTHAATATSPMAATRDTNLRADMGHLAACRGTENMALIG